jgi:hypothetical protein
LPVSWLHAEGDQADGLSRDYVRFSLTGLKRVLGTLAESNSGPVLHEIVAALP